MSLTVNKQTGLQNLSSNRPSVFKVAWNSHNLLQRDNDTEHNDIQHNDTQHNGTQHNGIQDNNE